MSAQPKLMAALSVELTISVSVHLVNGQDVLSDFQVAPDDQISSIISATKLAHPSPPGFHLFLHLDDTALAEDSRVADSGLQEGSSKLCVLSHSEEVVEMMEYFGETNQWLREPLDSEVPSLHCLKELQRLYEAAGTEAPASHQLFEGFLQDDCWKVRQLTIWSIARLRHSGLACVPQLTAALADENRSVHLEAARSLSRLANIDPTAIVPVLVEALGSKYEEVRQCVMLRLQGTVHWSNRALLLPGAEAASQKLVEALADDDSITRRIASTTLRKLNSEAWRKAVFRDMFDQDAWSAAQERLSARLKVRKRGAQLVVLDAELDRITDEQEPAATELRTIVEKMCAAVIAEAERCEQAATAFSSDANSYQVAVREGFDPGDLRSHLHADTQMYNFAVEGEAAWQCLPTHVIADVLAPHQKES